jgi:hypothetical protein
MLPIIPKPSISKRQKSAALVVAALADALQLTMLPLLGLGYVFDDFIDVVTALLLTAICGFKWQFILAFFMELLPIVDFLPTWTAVALLLSTHETPVGNQRVNVSQVHHRDPVDVDAVIIPPVQAPPVQAVR